MSCSPCSDSDARPVTHLDPGATWCRRPRKVVCSPQTLSGRGCENPGIPLTGPFMNTIPQCPRSQRGRARHGEDLVERRLARDRREQPVPGRGHAERAAAHRAPRPAGALRRGSPRHAPQRPRLGQLREAAAAPHSGNMRYRCAQIRRAYAGPMQRSMDSRLRAALGEAGFSTASHSQPMLTNSLEKGGTSGCAAQLPQGHLL